MVNKVAIAACSGMSPNGLISRVAASDYVLDNDDVIGLCMGLISGDQINYNLLIKEFPVLAINGCEGNCVEKILAERGVKPKRIINIGEELENQPFTPNDVARLDEEGEKCVEFIKSRIQEELQKIFDEE
jgi:uncharacterized metal-binding protein